MTTRRLGTVLAVVVAGAVCGIAVATTLADRDIVLTSSPVPTAESSASPQTSEPVPPSHSGGSPTPDPSHSESPILTWSTHGFPGGEILAATATDAGWLALGVGEAWFSADAVDWQPGDLGDLSQPPGEEGQAELRFADVTRFRDGWLALGVWAGSSDSMEATAFTSADGREWAQLAPEGLERATVVTAVASASDRVFVTNHAFAMGLGSLYGSQDGIAWTERVPPEGPAAMLDVTVASSASFAAVGYRYDSDTFERPVVWTSADGTTWSEEAGPELTRTTPWAVLATGSGLLTMLVTTWAEEGAPCTSETDCPGDILGAWYSTNGGQTWTEGVFPVTPTPPNAPHFEIELVDLAGGMAAIATTQSGPGVWTSADGISWSQADLPEMPASAIVTGAASNGQALLVFVASQEGQFVLVGESPIPP